MITKGMIVTFLSSMKRLCGFTALAITKRSSRGQTVKKYPFLVLCRMDFLSYDKFRRKGHCPCLSSGASAQVIPEILWSTFWHTVRTSERQKSLSAKQNSYILIIQVSPRDKEITTIQPSLPKWEHRENSVVRHAIAILFLFPGIQTKFSDTLMKSLKFLEFHDFFKSYIPDISHNNLKTQSFSSDLFHLRFHAL